MKSIDGSRGYDRLSLIATQAAISQKEMAEEVY